MEFPLERLEKSKLACFIHNVYATKYGLSILTNLLNFLEKSGLLQCLDHVFINNFGIPIRPNYIDAWKSKNIHIINYSKDISQWELPTIRTMHFWSQSNPEYKILYLHSKGISRENEIFDNVQSWVTFMLYCLVNHWKSCIKLLNHVDTVGCYYRSRLRYSPDHFSGNFWWATSKHISKIAIHEMMVPVDAEWFICRNDPLFVNIYTPDPYYDAYYKKSEGYEDIVTKNIQNWILYFESPRNQSIFYHNIDITQLCIRKCFHNGILSIPADDQTRAHLFSDPAYGIVKKIHIGELTFTVTNDIRIPYGPLIEKNERIQHENLNSTIVFVVLRHVSKPEHDALWRRCIDSIQRFHPLVPIIIIDDNSSLPIHEIENIRIIKSEFPGAGEILPYYYFLKEHWADKLVFLHDSMFLKEPLTDEHIHDQDTKFHWYFTRHISEVEHEDRKLISLLNNSSHLLSVYCDTESWKGMFGCAGITSYDSIMKLENKYAVFSTLVKFVKNRSQRMGCERVLGLLFHIENIVCRSCCSNFGDCENVCHEYDLVDAICKTFSGR